MKHSMKSDGAVNEPITWVTMILLPLTTWVLIPAIAMAMFLGKIKNTLNQNYSSMCELAQIILGLKDLMCLLACSVHGLADSYIHQAVSSLTGSALYIKHAFRNGFNMKVLTRSIVQNFLASIVSVTNDTYDYGMHAAR